MSSIDDWIESCRELDVSDEEVEDERKHNKLLDAIGALDGKKKNQVRQRTEVAREVSEFHISTDTGKVGLGDLVGALGSKLSHTSLKKQLNRVQNNQKVVDTPLSKPEQERTTRSLAYEETKKDVTKWDPVVEKNRKAEHLEFPLQKPDLRLVTTDKFVKRFQARTPLEVEVAALLAGGKDVALPENRALTKAEERALKAMSLEEARERRAELQKHRALLSYKEAKARRLKKIKSKKYHRILRKEKEKNEKKAMEELQHADPEAFLAKLHNIDKDRMQERMSLKHRGASKQMKKRAIFGKYDDTARQMVQDMIQKSKELTQKVPTVLDESSDSEEEENVQLEKNSEEKSEVASNPWMSSQPHRKKYMKALQNDEQEAEEEVQDQEVVNKEVEMERVSGKMEESDEDESKIENGKDVDIDDLFESMEKKKVEDKKQKQKKPSKRKKIVQKKKEKESESESESDSESDMDSDKETGQKVLEFDHSNIGDSLISSSLTRKQTLEDFESNWSDKEEEKSEKKTCVQEKPEDANFSKKGKKNKKKGPIKVDPNKFMTVDSNIRSSVQPDLTEDAADDIDASIEEEKRLTLADAFADDDVIDEFVTEKKDRIAKDKPKDLCLALPGWGDWGGDGLQISKKRRKRFTIKAPKAQPRKDRDLDNVIISEAKDNSIAKHQVSELPFPYRNIHQFEASVRQPIGKTWNPETAYRKLIQPKIATQQGTVIDPISKTETFKNLKRKGAIEDDRKGTKKGKNEGSSGKGKSKKGAKNK